MRQYLTSETWAQWIRIARRLTIVVGMLNFVIFVAIATYLGGDAVNGKVEGGRYYLFGVRAEGGRKVYTEVSERVFNYSRWHVYTVFATWPLVMAAGFAEAQARKHSKGN